MWDELYFPFGEVVLCVPLELRRAELCEVVVFEDLGVDFLEEKVEELWMRGEE